MRAPANHPDSAHSRRPTYARIAWSSIAVLSVLAACSEDDPAPITNIDLLSVTENQEVSGLVTLRVDAANADEVRYEIGDDLLTIRHDAPFDYLWNTRNTRNGIHLLRVIAVGKTNNARDEASIIVNNVGFGAEAVVLLEPIRATVALGDTFRFSARVLGLTGRAVDWFILGGDEDGTVDSSGLYLAPLEMPRPPKAGLVARARGNAEVADTADISLVSPPRPG